MTRNSFNHTLNTGLRGKRCRVETDAGTFVGWVERIHHGRGSVVLFDAVDQDTADNLGAVYVRIPEVVVALTPSKRIEYRRGDHLAPHPEYPGGVTPKAEVVTSSMSPSMARRSTGISSSRWRASGSDSDADSSAGCGSWEPRVS
jgi:ParB family chromosome partitioning protein